METKFFLQLTQIMNSKYFFNAVIGIICRILYPAYIISLTIQLTRITIFLDFKWVNELLNGYFSSFKLFLVRIK